MKEEITKAIEEALQGKKQVRVIFHKEAIGDLQYLLAMISGGYISVSATDQRTLSTIRQARNWGLDGNRTMVLGLTDTFDLEFFVGRMGRRGVLERIEAVK